MDEGLRGMQERLAVFIGARFQEGDKIVTEVKPYGVAVTIMREKEVIGTMINEDVTLEEAKQMLSGINY